MTASISPSWLAELLDRDDLTDICFVGAESVFVDRGNGLEPLAMAGAKWTPEEAREWVLSALSQAGKTWDARHPFVDATLPSGHRLHAVFPPISPQGLLVSLRKLARPGSALRRRWGTDSLYPRLSEAIRAGESILIAGATGSGKTTLATELLSDLPGSERIVALEDTPELRPEHPHFVSLVSRPPNADGFGEVTLRTLLRQCLRMRPDRIVLGECRGNEVLELLQALNTGHRGALATLHANSGRDALRRVELLCLLAAGGSLPSQVIRELLSTGIQWVAHVGRAGDGAQGSGETRGNGETRGSGSRRITGLWRIEGREGDAILFRPWPVAEALFQSRVSDVRLEP